MSGLRNSDLFSLGFNDDDIHQNNINGAINQPQMQSQNDSMQCSEIMTMNHTNGLLQLGASADEVSNSNIAIERAPEKRIKGNEHGYVDANKQGAPNNGGVQQAALGEKQPSFLMKEYDSMQFKYSNEEFSNSMNSMCRLIACSGHASEVACRFPLQKMIRAITKKFQFNELELIFFGYVLEEGKWKVDDIEMRKQAYFMKDFLNITEVKDLLEYKSVLLYLILTAYGVKHYLNEESDLQVFTFHVNTLVRDFSNLFAYWSKNNASSSFKIVPKVLNRVYRSLTRRPSDQAKKQHEDYNALVDAIIQISPPYNNEKTEASSDLTPPISPKPSKNNNNKVTQDMSITEQKKATVILPPPRKPSQLNISVSPTFSNSASPNPNKANKVSLQKEASIATDAAAAAIVVDTNQKGFITEGISRFDISNGNFNANDNYELYNGINNHINFASGGFGASLNQFAFNTGTAGYPSFFQGLSQIDSQSIKHPLVSSSNRNPSGIIDHQLNFTSQMQPLNESLGQSQTIFGNDNIGFSHRFTQSNNNNVNNVNNNQSSFALSNTGMNFGNNYSQQFPSVLGSQSQNTNSSISRMVFNKMNQNNNNNPPP